MEKAFQWGLSAALSEYAPAQLAVAYMYRQGIGTTIDLTKAYEWNSKAAIKDSAEGACQIATMLENGEGVKRDEAEALYWYERSAKLGSWMAHAALAGIYRRGRLGVTVNEIKADEHERASTKIQSITDRKFGGRRE